VGPDATRLRARHPDRNSVAILPVVARIGIETGTVRPAGLRGWIYEVPTAIHVPRPYSDAFRRLPPDRSRVRYRVRLRYGSSLEPWVAGVEFQ
jgi:hypothetical protein